MSHRTGKRLGRGLLGVGWLFLLFPGLAQAQKMPEAVLIGGTIAQSGPMSAEVGPFKKMMEMWAEMVNQPYSSPLTFAASTVAEKHGIPMVAAEANSTAIFTRGFKWLVGVIDDGPKWSDYYFDLLKIEAKSKSIGFVIQDTLHAKEVGSGAVPKAKESGLEVVFEETVQASATDFTPTITKLKTANPDIVYVSAFPPFAIGFYKQAMELGPNPREYHIIHHGAAFRNAVGEASANFVTGENY